jgi:hypothetical protein
MNATPRQFQLPGELQAQWLYERGLMLRDDLGSFCLRAVGASFCCFGLYAAFNSSTVPTPTFRLAGDPRESNRLPMTRIGWSRPLMRVTLIYFNRGKVPISEIIRFDDRRRKNKSNGYPPLVITGMVDG